MVHVLIGLFASDGRAMFDIADDHGAATGTYAGILDMIDHVIGRFYGINEHHGRFGFVVALCGGDAQQSGGDGDGGMIEKPCANRALPAGGADAIQRDRNGPRQWRAGNGGCGMSFGVQDLTTVQRSTWKLFYLAVALCALATACRYLVIELRLVATMCEADAPPFWCAIRQFIITLFYSDAIGAASLSAAVLAFLLYRQRGSRFIATLAVLLGAPAIVLYSADIAVPGFLIGMLRLLRDERGD